MNEQLQSTLFVGIDVSYKSNYVFLILFYHIYNIYIRKIVLHLNLFTYSIIP